MAGPFELHEPSVVHDALDDGCGELVVSEECALSRELDVYREDDAPPLVALRYDLEEQPCPVDVDPNSSSMSRRAFKMSAKTLSNVPSRLARPSSQTSWATAIMVTAVAMWVLPLPVCP